MSLNAAGVETGLKRAESAVSKFSKNVNSNLKAQIAGAIGASALIAASKAAIDHAGHINDLSTQLGISTGRLQEFAFAAKQSGSSIDEFAGVFQKLAGTRQEALSNPAGEMAQNFQKLGVSINDLRSAKLEDLISKIGQAFADARNPQELLAAGFQTMGRGARPLIGAMREGLQDFAEDARRTGQIIDENLIQKLDDLGDTISQVAGTMMSAFSFGLGKIVDKVKEAARLIHGEMSAVGAYFGTLAGGGSDADAKTAGYNARIQAATQYVQSDMERDTRQRRRRELLSQAIDFSDSATRQGTGQQERGMSGYQPGRLNNLQQIGGFSGVDPIVQALGRSLSLEERIARGVERTAAGIQRMPRTTTDSF